MKLWNTIKSWFSNEAIVEEAPPVEAPQVESCVETFIYILREAGCYKHILKVDGVALFEAWYTGPCDEESIRLAIPSFKAAYPAVNAKLAGRL
mgnify:FL=1|tara:strand:+ start:1786 stop:2064 length:279 start_codon:yes stop_codon:yes gene_type:complete